MDSIRIRGGQPLQGTVAIDGAKNAALPLMAASLLTDQPVTLSRYPQLGDTRSMADLLRRLGVEATTPGKCAGTMGLVTPSVTSTTADYDLVRRMRASVLVLGPLLARSGHAEISLPGGCAIGTRPIDLHLKALTELGASIELEGGYVRARASRRGLRGGRVRFAHVSVGATENTLMAAVLARGETRIENAAREPEVTDLARCLVAMGAHVEGLGTSTLHVQGDTVFRPASHRILGDRIEAGSYAAGALITGGRLRLAGAPADAMTATLEVLRSIGAEVEITADDVVVNGSGTLAATDVETGVYPAFPTDMQAQMMAVLCLAGGRSRIVENIFENRFMHVSELVRMGARIKVRGRTAEIEGVQRLLAAPVMATDLRASLSLVLGALAAEGESVIRRVYHLDRGYSRLETKLRAVGAIVRRTSEDGST
ncbi:MAG: UDP-N-acetylglucosamine 1-carboxyvinyltransferase [Rhodospirillales bacterium]|nr:UDP-N-acetylglucosamine 1-carboxyvinyltransferase [Rhodospirillales bacterium]